MMVMMNVGMVTALIMMITHKAKNRKKTIITVITVTITCGNISSSNVYYKILMITTTVMKIY